MSCSSCTSSPTAGQREDDNLVGGQAYAPRAGGGYAKKVTYEWVGDGQGEFEREEESPKPSGGFKFSPQLICLVLLGALLVCLIGVKVMQHGVDAGSVVIEPEHASTTAMQIVGKKIDKNASMETTTTARPKVYVDMRG